MSNKKINDAGQKVEYFNPTHYDVAAVKVTPLMHDVKDPAKEKRNARVRIEMYYEDL